jgi:TPR repeat protein
MHDQGLGVPVDPKRALELYVQAADGGDPQARRALERLLGPAPGIGRSRDDWRSGDDWRADRSRRP